MIMIMILLWSFSKSAVKIGLNYDIITWSPDFFVFITEKNGFKSFHSTIQVWSLMWLFYEQILDVEYLCSCYRNSAEIFFFILLAQPDQGSCFSVNHGVQAANPYQHCGKDMIALLTWVCSTDGRKNLSARHYLILKLESVMNI